MSLTLMIVGRCSSGGLDRDEARQVLDGKKHVGTVRERPIGLDITGSQAFPSIVFAGKIPVTGAQVSITMCKF